MMKRLAIRPFMVFNGEYEDAKMDRIGVTNASDLMEKVMFEEDCLHFEPDKSTVVKNGRRTDVFKKLRAFADSIDRENEMLLFYFCGHGCPDYYTNKLYLAMWDMDFDHVPDNGIDTDAINGIIKESHIKYYGIILDCCHAGMHSLGKEDPISYSIPIEKYSDLQGAFAIPTTEASGSFQTLEIDGKQYPPFTYYFFKTLQEGIENEFMRISFGEVYENVKMQLNSKSINLPVVQKKGDLFDVGLWENLKYRKAVNTPILDSTDSEDVLNVLLVKSAIEHPIKFDDFGIPLGLWVLKDYIEKYSMSVRIEVYDERLELQKAGGNERKRKKVLDNFPELIKGYDVVGVSMSSAEVGPALKKLKIAKEQGKVTTAGGIFTSSNERYLLETGVVDYVTPGVGTSALRKLLEWLQKQKMLCQKKKEMGDDYRFELNNELPGVATIENLQTFFVPTDIGLSNMSFQTWKIIIDRYKQFLYDDNLKTYKMDIFSTRGCKGTCTFCSVQKECGRHISYRSEVSVINEIKNLYNEGFTYFSLKDEDCLTDELHFMKILRGVQELGIRFKIRTRVDHLLDRRDFLQELHELGVIEIQYGIESFDISVLNRVSKGIKKKQSEKIKSFIKLNADYGITANCSFILGLSGENEDYYDELFSFIQEIYDYSESCKPKIYINFMTPHPMSSSFQVGKDFRMITTDLNYFTHKYPIGFYEQESGSGYAIRKKMIETYESIVRYTGSTKFNPSLEGENGYEHLEKFLVGNKYIIENPELPDYCGRKQK